MLKFKYVAWRNFLSTGNVFNRIDLDAATHTLIIGNNGAGKSTLLDALCFALYGKGFRNVTKPSFINSVNMKDCLVEVEFTTAEHTYLIRRGMKPSVFEIVCDGELIPELPSAAEQQEYLEGYILKCTYKAFTQVVILGAASYVPFMRLTPAARREILEDLLDIEIFAIMQSLLKDKASAHKDVLAGLQSQIAVAASQHELVEQYTTQWKARQEQRRADIDEELVQHETAIRELEPTQITYLTQRDQCDALLAQSPEIERKWKKADRAWVSLRERVVAAQKDLTFFETNSTCARCTQPIDPTLAARQVETLRAAVASVTTELADVERIRTKLDTKLHKLMEVQSGRANIQLQLDTIDRQRLVHQSRIDQLQAERETTFAEPPPAPTDIADMSRLQSDLDAANYTRYIMEQAAVLLKDKGIRTRVIQQYLPIINQLVNEYLTALNFSVQFTLDDQFKETIKSRYRDTFSYESFSEGEKRRIDLALLLTWRAVACIKNSVYTNLLIFDEVFDSSLDSTGCDDFLRILQQMDPDTNVFVISHRTSEMLDKFARVLSVTKVQGFSEVNPVA